MSNLNSIVAIAGSGAMGAGIAQVASMAGHTVMLYDTNGEVIEKALVGIASSLEKLVAKGKLAERAALDIRQRIIPASSLSELQGASLFIEAIVEKLAVKSELFAAVEEVLIEDAILASNTSSLSITAIASSCKKPERVIGLHFFNPAVLMPLVEVIPALQTNTIIPTKCLDLMRAWGKVPVLAKDTPGFIVNRVARPFYGESLRILEEGIADIATIDWALKTFGNFRMGPFELMDLIGNDVNYAVTETVWSQMYFDPRYKPSLVQKKMTEAKRLGRKSGRGYYDYREEAILLEPVKDEVLGNVIFIRVLSMLINEAVDALYLGVATKEELDLAMTKGVNYPKGLLKWADEIGLNTVLDHLNHLNQEYGEDRYRPSVLLRKMADKKEKFF
ncbi:MAG: 3-hydroxybutyryl-CoA dehydrogenase [Bacteroidetes bacterium]|nr:3-hydroxybutyryl-CoA dehydrogenase [Bacteroidota bacterium]